MSVIEHDHWVCPRCDSVDGPTSGNLCDICAYDDGATQKVVGLVPADAYRGAVSPERVHAYVKEYGRLGYDAAHLDRYLRGEFDIPTDTRGQ